MLERVRLQNFKAHRDTEIKLGRLTVLVGPNGAGKSSVLQAINNPSRLAKGSVVTFSGTNASGPWTFERTDRQLRQLDPPPVEPVASAAPRPRPGTIRKPIAQRPASGVPMVQFNEMLGRVVFIEPDPRSLAAPAYSAEVSPTLLPDGTGLSEVLAHLVLSEPDTFAAIITGLKSVVPQVDRVRIKRTAVERPRTRVLRLDDVETELHESESVMGTSLVFDVAGNTDIPASDMSGGTLLTLGILTALVGPGRPQVALIDDLDHGLHPKAQWDLLAYLRKLLDRFPELQIVATSHSPDLVDELQPEEVVVMALRKDGTVAARPLTECPRADMIGVLRAGELWSAVGEDWVKAEPETGAFPWGTS